MHSKFINGKYLAVFLLAFGFLILLSFDAFSQDATIMKLLGFMVK